MNEFKLNKKKGIKQAKMAEVGKEKIRGMVTRYLKDWNGELSRVRCSIPWRELPGFSPSLSLVRFFLSKERQVGQYKANGHGACVLDVLAGADSGTIDRVSISLLGSKKPFFFNNAIIFV